LGSGERFAAFSFVDRIVQVGDDGSISGRYTVPAQATRFPASLMAEAVGQLAAWGAMARLDFAWRPVAGLAAATRYHAEPRPGATLDLHARIARCDAEAVAYDGHARIDGQPAIELVDCVGPMLPLAEFDDPAALRADFGLLTGSGAPPGRFRGVPEPHFDGIESEPGRRISARLQVPTHAPLFADHFPRKPVYPGTLLLDALASLALRLAREGLPGARPIVSEVRDVKIRSFTPPGAVLDCSAELVGPDGDSLRLKLAARSADGKAVASARLLAAAGAA
jgi:3-hydroxymyristoyl/3-hydroxydecanoyl-(acyl carrier protein) dehydratase